MLSVDEALARILAAFSPLPAETVSVDEAFGRVLAAAVTARITQPPHAVSAMDGYAVRAADLPQAPTRLRVVGAVPAGSLFERPLGAGEAVRIFTGAPLPEGADSIVIQEDTEQDGDEVIVREVPVQGVYVRARGLDFNEGDPGVAAGTWLTPRHVGLIAAMDVPWVSVYRRPRVAILSTGDELVMPGEQRRPSQIVSSNAIALSALVRDCGGEPINLGIAADNRDSLERLAAGAEGADLLLTTGGASVGDHDLVRAVLAEEQLSLDFWRIAMRPGKPLMFGHLGKTPMIGLPGNPVSSLVCGLLFVRPAMERMLGLARPPHRLSTAELTAPLPANDKRQDYMRATLAHGPDGQLSATPFPKQDSSMLRTLSRADGLIVRAPHAPPIQAGDVVPVLLLD